MGENIVRILKWLGSYGAGLWSHASKLGGFTWAVLGILVAIFYVHHCMVPAMAGAGGFFRGLLAFGFHLVVLILGLSVFRLIYLNLKAADGRSTRRKSRAATSAEAFPSPSTKLVAIWLLVFVILSIFGVFLAFEPPNWPKGLRSFFGVSPENANQINEALITVFGAAVGSAITTILAFFRHASVRKDFDPCWAPWYVARPIMGMLLGLTFFFLIKGGIWATVGATLDDAEINKWSLAGIGALVGLFSNNAIAKLREVFHVLFHVEREERTDARSSLAERLAKLSDAVRVNVVTLLDASVREALAAGNSDEAERQLAELEDNKKREILEKAPAEAKSLLVVFLYPTVSDLQERLKALDDDLRKEIVAALPPNVVEKLAAGSVEEAEGLLRSLEEEDKTNLLASLSEKGKGFLVHYVGSPEE